MIDEGLSVNDVPLEQLLQRYRGMILRFCSYKIPGYDHEDIYQELCLVLLKCRRGYRDGLGTKFGTYLYNALRNRVWHLNYFHRKRLSVWQQESPLRPQAALVPRDPMAEADFRDVDLADLRARLSQEARDLFDQITTGHRTVASIGRNRRHLAAEIATALGYEYDGYGYSEKQG